MESFLEKAATYEQTRDASDVLGKRVLAKSGSVVGRVKEMRLDSQHRSLEGVLIGRGLFRSSLYVSEEYISRLTPQAVILSIDPAVMLRQRPVVSRDGKRFGTVKDVVREKETNEVAALVVRRRWFWTYEIPVEEFRQTGKAVVLKKSYEQARSSFKNAS